MQVYHSLFCLPWIGKEKERLDFDGSESCSHYGFGQRLAGGQGCLRPAEGTGHPLWSARAEGYGVILCAAGMAAHLAGAFAANTTLPVIGIPMKGGAMDGLDALLATVQMPSGIPVATVALNGAKNAAWLAAEILALGDEALAGRLEAERTAMAQQIAAKEEKLQKEIEEL